MMGQRFTMRYHARSNASSHYVVLISSITAPCPTHSLLTSNAENRTCVSHQTLTPGTDAVAYPKTAAKPTLEPIAVPTSHCYKGH
jgi:hypothetical protein